MSALQWRVLKHATGPPVIEVERLRYVRLGTRNLPTAIDFAQRILGLQLIEKNAEQATFRW
jgi:2,3-dihydroxy-p-cumate/2,3-dihydroxybenzoate 3,4-dioxygenase